MEVRACGNSVRAQAFSSLSRPGTFSEEAALRWLFLYGPELVLRQGSRLAGQEKVPRERRKTEPGRVSVSWRADVKEKRCRQSKSEAERVT